MKIMMNIDVLEDNFDIQSDSYYSCLTYPLLLILSGPSGVGKDTVARMLIQRRPESFHFVVTATTRLPRDEEVHGIDYYFVSHDEFAQMIEQDELLEHAIVYNDYKGIPKRHIREALGSGRDVILRVDVQGASTVKRLVPNSISVFLTTRTEEGLVNRLQRRKQDTAEGMALRTATARQEMKRMEEFDYCVVNPEGHPEIAVDRILNIIDAAHCRMKQEAVTL